MLKNIFFCDICEINQYQFANYINIDRIDDFQRYRKKKEEEGKEEIKNNIRQCKFRKNF